jgi:alanine-glyoxylate transaminase/serine-glyoxylate transaminase/serine-pyruvate transaminase
VQLEATGRRAIRTPYRAGYPIDPSAVEEALRADAKRVIVAVFAVHTDTASGITHDVAAIRAAIDRAGHPALLVADVIASLGAAPFAMDALGVNMAVGASQKGLMSPPGMGFVAVDERAAAVAARNSAPRAYWDWKRRRGPQSYTKFFGTPPQNLLFGIEAALGLIEREGLDAVIARHALLARAVQAAVERWSSEGALKLHCLVPQARSVSVTTIEVREGIDVEALRTVARERFQVAFAGGLALSPGAFRIGHLGDLNAAMILGCLAGGKRRSWCRASPSDATVCARDRGARFVNATAIFYPVIALALWTFAVLMLVPRARFKVVRERRVRAADFALGESDNVPPEARLPNRNYMNLLELPVLFYVACIVLYVTAKADVVGLGLAWTFVALRIAHSAVHLTYNHVVHRLNVFALSTVVLLALWIWIAVVV